MCVCKLSVTKALLASRLVHGLHGLFLADRHHTPTNAFVGASFYILRRGLFLSALFDSFVFLPLPFHSSRVFAPVLFALPTKEAN